MSKSREPTVDQLKEELRKRNLATHGNKSALVARLMEALLNEDKHPKSFKFDVTYDQDTEPNENAHVNTQMMELLLKMSTKMEEQSVKSTST